MQKYKRPKDYNEFSTNSADKYMGQGPLDVLGRNAKERYNKTMPNQNNIEDPKKKKKDKFSFLRMLGM